MQKKKVSDLGQVGPCHGRRARHKGLAQGHEGHEEQEQRTSLGHAAPQSVGPLRDL